MNLNAACFVFSGLCAAFNPNDPLQNLFASGEDALLGKSVEKSAEQATEEAQAFRAAERAAAEESAVRQAEDVVALREWAEFSGWIRKPGDGPETYGEINQAGRFEWRLKIKYEPSYRPGLAEGSQVPRFDARLNSSGDYINPFTGELGGQETGTHIPLDSEW